MNIVIPGWIVAVIGVMYRFVAGSFGISLPRPYRTTMCKPFWIALLGCTVFLPIVLLCWCLRLILGKGGRAGRAFEAIDDLLRLKPVKRALLCLLILAGVSSVMFVFISVFVAFILKYGWMIGSIFFIFFVLIILGAAVGAPYGAVSIAVKLERRRREALASREREGKEKRPARVFRAVRVFFSAMIFLPKILLVGLWQSLVFFGLMSVAIYKKFCPLVEFP